MQVICKKYQEGDCLLGDGQDCKYAYAFEGTPEQGLKKCPFYRTIDIVEVVED